MRNKVTLDMMESCGCDCKCIISESDGTNTLELYMWSVSSEAAIVFSWTDPDGTGHSEGALGTFLDNGDYYYSANPEIFTGNRLITMTVNWGDFTSREIYFQCVNLTAETNFTVTRDLSADDLYRVAAAIDDDLPIATTTSTGVVQIGSGLNVDETGVISTQIASKEALGIVKIGDGINVSEGTISLPPATFETLGGVKAGDNMLLGSDGMIGVPLATTKYPGVVQIGNGLDVVNGVISISNNTLLTEYKYLSDLSVKYNGITYTATKNSSGLIDKITDSDGNEFEPVIDGTINDVAFHNAVFMSIAVHSGLRPPEFDKTGFIGLFTPDTRDIANSRWRNNISGYNDIILTGGSENGDALHFTSSQYGSFVCNEPNTVYAIVKSETSEVINCIITKRLSSIASTQHYGFNLLHGGGHLFFSSAAYDILQTDVDCTEYHVYCFTRSGGTVYFYIDGILIGTIGGCITGLYSNMMYLNNEYFGSTRLDPPIVCDFLMCAFGIEYHNEATVQKNMAYLMRKYGVT